MKNSTINPMALRTAIKIMFKKYYSIKRTPKNLKKRKKLLIQIIGLQLGYQNLKKK